MEIEFVKECHVELHEYSIGKAMYRKHSSYLLERNQPSEENASNGTKYLSVSFGRKHDVELKNCWTKLFRTIVKIVTNG